MIELITGFVITIVSLYMGFNLGKHASIATPDITNKVNQIFKRVVPKTEVGAIERPTQQDNFYRDNPQYAQEQEAVGSTLDDLSTK